MNKSAIGRRWEGVLESCREKNALIDIDNCRTWSFQDLSLAMFDCLESLKIEDFDESDVVIIWMQNSFEWIAWAGACLIHGIHWVPVDSSEPRGRVETIANLVGARWVVSPAGLEERKPLQSSEYESDFCLAKLTSGTSGEPKVLRFSEEAMIADADQIALSMGLKSLDRNLVVIPLGHSYALGNIVLQIFLQGMPAVLCDVPFPHVLKDVLVKHEVRVFPAIPTLYDAWVKSGIGGDGLLGNMLFLSAGAPIGQDLAKDFYALTGNKIKNFYGSSETGGIAFDADGQNLLHGTGLGILLPGVSVRVGAEGQLSVSSKALHKDVIDGVCELDDLGKVDENVISLLGRRGRLVKIAGRRLELGEIERVLSEIPAVRQAYVFIDKKDPVRIIAAIEGTIEAIELKRFMKKRLAPWKVPRRFKFYDQFPRTPRGKIDRAVLESDG